MKSQCLPFYFDPHIEPVTEPYQFIFSNIFYLFIPTHFPTHLGPSPLFLTYGLPKLPPIALFPLFLGHTATVLSPSSFMVIRAISLMSSQYNISGSNMHHLQLTFLLCFVIMCGCFEMGKNVLKTHNFIMIQWLLI